MRELANPLTAKGETPLHTVAVSSVQSVLHPACWVVLCGVLSLMTHVSTWTAKAHVTDSYNGLRLIVTAPNNNSSLSSITIACMLHPEGRTFPGHVFRVFMRFRGLRKS